MHGVGATVADPVTGGAVAIAIAIAPMAPPWIRYRAKVKFVGSRSFK